MSRIICPDPADVKFWTAVQNYTQKWTIGPISLSHFSFYRPQTKLRKGNVFTPVCQLFCSRGEVSASVHAGIPPWAGTPPLGRHPPVQTATAADGTHPTGMHSCSDFFFVRTGGGVSVCHFLSVSGPMFLSGGLCLWSHVPSGGVCPGGSLSGRPPRQRPLSDEERAVRILL